MVVGAKTSIFTPDTGPRPRSPADARIRAASGTNEVSENVAPPRQVRTRVGSSHRTQAPAYRHRLSASSRVVFLSLLVLALSLGLATADSSHAQVPYDNPRVAHGPRAEAAAAIPNFRWRVRELNIGNISVALTNSGMVEYGHFPDACSGIETGAVTFPKGSYNVFLGHSLWIGGVKDATLWCQRCVTGPAATDCPWRS